MESKQLCRKLDAKLMAININPADQTIVQYAVLSGGANNTLNNIAPGANGTVLASNGASAQPTFQVVGSVAGFSSINIQAFTTAGSFTYTPTANMSYCVVQIVGGGGGGGSAGASQVGSGGGAGGYAQQTFSASTIGASKSLTVGAGGAATVNGSSSSFGSLITCNGGTAGASNLSGQGATRGGAGGTVSLGGTIAVSGGAGASGTAHVIYIPGEGGDSGLAPGGACGNTSTTNGTAGTKGAGGGGAYVSGTGGAGGPGSVLITEYIT